MKHPRILSILAGLVLAAAGRADVWLSPIFSDGAVLQHGKPVPIWGSGIPGEKVEIAFAGQTVSTTVDGNWKWMALLKPLAPSDQPRDLVVSGKNRNVVHNVLVGDVWFCAGQSNIEWPLRNSDGAKEAMAAGNLPTLRHLRIPRGSAGSPRDEFQSNWKTATPETVGDFTAIGFFFAREIQQKAHVPVGLINCTYGGTPIESWLAPWAVEAEPSAAAYAKEWEKGRANWGPQTAAFIEDFRKALQSPGSPVSRPNIAPDYNTPSGAYLAMLYPCFPYAVRGFVWYQGESNAGRATGYRTLFPTFIRSVRDLWGDPELPFLYVQLPNWDDPNDKSHQTWAELRDAQSAALSVPKTGMAVAIDVGNAENLHPTNKEPVGHRLALIAEHLVYGFPGEYSGPEVSIVTTDAGGLRVTFSHADGGLVAKGDLVGAFEIAGADAVFHPADARLDGASVVVRSNDVPQPVKVRYAWANAPKTPLFNRDGLPASPFQASLAK
ncbi:sialate O-acetylesterase [Opitutaceae bacterium EW11]|nr:sialate O-acetylesterase [Opitutaceae bacterium EW11]